MNNKDKIRNHRTKMGFSNTRYAIDTKTKEECMELYNELDIPTSSSNLVKEIFDVYVMLIALCDNRGLDIEKVIADGIEINESRI